MQLSLIFSKTKHNCCNTSGIQCKSESIISQTWFAAFLHSRGHVEGARSLHWKKKKTAAAVLALMQNFQTQRKHATIIEQLWKSPCMVVLCLTERDIVSRRCVTLLARCYRAIITANATATTVLPTLARTARVTRPESTSQQKRNKKKKHENCSARSLLQHARPHRELLRTREKVEANLH